MGCTKCKQDNWMMTVVMDEEKDSYGVKCTCFICNNEIWIDAEDIDGYEIMEDQ